MRAGECRIPHQALLEFYAVVARRLPGLKKSLLTSGEAREEIEVLLLTSIVLYPVENVVRLGSVCYGDLRAKLVRRAPVGLRRALPMLDNLF